ncbi:TetR/AcrR family transcriptional regulator [Thalassococcus sp. S3]|uniref:TetR/AcrR family transcriptional regulator n=1 Tax=Thalassococcus sp. S3 TaxID=2017482 RepID=UPI0010242A44|nr:TetR/AcrR family transcriptional regulator [Thalassococcus sp. S3]QBF32789.1 TetR family transcriptional regulator [Thalassococcus sp. S3]
MRDKTRAAREEAIAEAAYRLLEARGFGGVSMLNVAKAAKASNETLYRWYGDKVGLFAALVKRNAEEARTLLDEAETGASALQTLGRFGPVLLHVVTGARAVALNRAAAAEPSGALGQAIAKEGREDIAPRLVMLLGKLDAEGVARITEPAKAAEIYFNLLIGDWQIRRAIGVLAEPSEEQRQARAQTALDAFLMLYPPAP